MFIKTITVALFIACVSTVSAEEITVQKEGGWNIGTPAQSIKLEAGSRYLLRFNINCRKLDRYGAVFLITKGRSGAQKIASIYPGTL